MTNENEGKFKAGDIVQLKSGGPIMTISTINNAIGKIFCRWFSGDKLERGEFKGETLKFPDKKEK